MGQSRPLFVLFLFFSHYNFNTNWKKHRWCAWDLNPGRRMIGADETTELWRLPQLNACLFWVSEGQLLKHNIPPASFLLFWLVCSVYIIFLFDVKIASGWIWTQVLELLKLYQLCHHHCPKLWHSCQSDRFGHQRTRVQNPVIGNFIKR